MSAPASVPALAPQAGKLRVLFVIPGDGQGSSMIFARRQARNLASVGIEADLFYLRSRTSPRQLLAEFRRFRSELARLRPAVIHAHYGTVTALFAAAASGVLPLVITYRGSDLNPPPPSYGWRAQMRAACGVVFSQLAALRAQRIICVSHSLAKRLWWRRKTARILPTGVDAGIFWPQPRALARKQLGWNDLETVTLFNAGHNDPVKRLPLAIEAVEQARRTVPSLRMEILNGSVDPDLVAVFMNAADCLLLTSVSEGSPTVIQEALACDLPVVTVEVGDVVERLKGVEDARVAAADASVLAQALVHLVDPPRRSNGSEKVPEFCARRIARELQEIYHELAEVPK